MQKVLKCYGCKELINRTELIDYKGNHYCKRCYNEKIERDKFSDYICKLYHLKTPGPRIWAERKRLLNDKNNPMTDEGIIRTLCYLYEVKGANRLSDSIYRAGDKNIVAEANRYYANQDYKLNLIIESIVNAPTEVNYIKLEQKEETKEKINPDDILNNIDWLDE